LALLMGAAPGTDIVLTAERMEAARNFANKIWNAARLLFMRMESSGVEPWTPGLKEQYRPEADSETLEVPLEDRWIFSRLNACAEQANAAIEQYRFHEAAQVLWQFFWHEFCDWYVELKKLRFRESSGLDAHWRNALGAFEMALRLLHPVMPFLTEELWQRMGGAERPISIALAPYPQYSQSATDLTAERDVQILQDIIGAARDLRADMKLDPKLAVSGTVYARGFAYKVGVASAESIRQMARVNLEFRHDGAPPVKGAAVRSTHEFDLALEVPLAQTGAHRKRLEKDAEQLDKNVGNLRGQLADEASTSKKPAKVVEEMRQKLAAYEAQLAKIKAALDGLNGS
jgi:valyl-tRNA synthetase